MATPVMQLFGFRGEMAEETDPRSNRSFYRYYIISEREDRCLFDGAAGDAAEAMQTISGHLRLLTKGVRQRADLRANARRRRNAEKSAKVAARGVAGWPRRLALRSV
jgi:hypothetical protein